MEFRDPASLPINPYEPPGIYLSDVSEVPDEPSSLGGAWRDEMLLVVPWRGPLTLPAVCIKTGIPLTRLFSTSQTIASLPLDHPLANEKWPVSREWEEDIPLSQLQGMVLCAIGPLLFVASLAAATSKVSVAIVMPLMGISLFSILLGLMMLAFSYRVFLKVVDVQSPYLWLEGAHPDFLKELPPWTATTGSRAS